jgi:hypothetical protein
MKIEGALPLLGHVRAHGSQQSDQGESPGPGENVVGFLQLGVLALQPHQQAGAQGGPEADHQFREVHAGPSMDE